MLELKQLQKTLAKPNTQLLAVNTHAGKLTAQFAVGALKNAKSITVLVPGMGSGAHGSTNMHSAAQSLQQEITRQGQPKNAVIVWAGYDSPNMLEEPFTQKAKAGGQLLAQDINRLQQEYPQAKLHVLAHSYGSTTAAAALELVNLPVHSFITIGSAGLIDGTTRAQLKTKQVYAATAAPNMQAWGVNNKHPVEYVKNLHLTSDLVAPIGIRFGFHSVDPRNLQGAQTIAANNKNSKHYPVGSHALYNKNPARGSDPGIGYLNPGAQTTVRIGKIIAGNTDPP